MVYSLSNLQFYLLDIGVFEQTPFYDLYYIPFSLAMPAVLLLYGFSLIDRTLGRHQIFLLFVPFIVVMIIALVYRYQLTIGQKEPGYSDFLDGFPVWSEFIAIIYSIVATALLLRLTKRSQDDLQFSMSSTKPQLEWFRLILKFQIFSISLWAVSEILFSDMDESYYYYPLWIVLSVIIYWMGHVGIYRFGIIQERKQLRQRTKDRFSISEVSTSKNELIAAFERYLVLDSNYLNPNLSLESTAEALHVSSGHLSKTINTELQQSFKDYVNTLRVDKAKSFLGDPEFSNYTLVAIGLEAGFNSKSAFNASFKKITGSTPSQFKSQATN